MTRHLAAFSITLALLIAPFALADGLPSLIEPALSPDGSEIAFVSSGDIWTVPSAGGEARLLIAHGANESRPLYSPDGKQLAFISDRSGNGDIYLLELETGKVTRLTFGDAQEHLDAWSADGKFIYFSTSAYDLGGGTQDIYRVRTSGGTPMPVVHEPYVNEFFAAPNPKTGAVAYCSGGMADRTWWRKGHNHGDECEIYLLAEGGATPSVQKLTPGGAREMWPMWSPNGGALFYVSDATGAFNLYVKNASGKHEQLTHFSDGRLHWPSISFDGSTIVFERGNSLWTFDTAGGEAKEIPIKLRGVSAVPAPDHHTFTTFDELAVSPDGRKIALVTHGEIFAASARDDSTATRVSKTAAVESHATWSRDSRRLAYVSNRDGDRHIYQYDFGTGEETRLTNGDDDTRPRYSPDVRSLVYQAKGREIRLMDLFTKKEKTLVADRTFDLAPFDRQSSSFSISPAGDWVAFAAPGPKGFENVYVVPTSGQNEPRQITFLANAGSNTISWSPGESYLLFGTGQRTENYQLAKVDLIPRTPRFKEDQFKDLFRTTLPRPLRGDGSDENLSDDEGTRVPCPPEPPVDSVLDNGAIGSGGHAATPANMLTPADQRIRQNPSQLPAGESMAPDPDGLAAVAASGAEEKPTSKPKTSSTTKSATTLATTNASTKPTVTLPPLFRPAEPTPIVFEDIRRRTRLLNPGFDVDFNMLSPDGKLLLLIGTSANQQNLYLYPLDDTGKEPVARQLTSTAGSKSFVQFSPDGKDVYYLEQGKVTIVSLETRTPKTLAVVAEMEADFDADKLQVFEQAWRYVRDQFCDATFNGADWNAVKKRYDPLIHGARTEDEMRRILLLMLGELNASHVGISAAAALRPSTGRLGLRFDRAQYDSTGKLRVTEVFALSPAAIAGITVGDYLLSVDGKAISPRISLDGLLQQKIGKRVQLKIASNPEGSSPREIALQPVDLPTERGLAYRAWVDSRRKYVEDASKGKLGYVHLADMTESALARLNADLDSDNQTRQGVVVDVRNNRGGFVNGFAIDVFSRKNYLTMVRRGFGPSPARVRLGQRALDAPTVLITNRGTYSDGEDFTEAFRALKLGKVVGEPTAGSVIFTSMVTLLDGTKMGLPTTKVIGADGKTLEGHPRAVDIAIDRTPGESYIGKDAQLDAAIEALLDHAEARAKEQ